MADDDNNVDENQEGEGGGKSKKKLIIIIAIVTILAIGLSVGATVFLLGDDEEPAENIEEVVGEPVKEPATYLAIKPPFLVTFNVDGRQRYMQISLSVSSRDSASLDALEHHMPLIRSKLITAYGGQNFDEIKTDSGKIALQAQTVEVINGVLEGEGANKIENIFFTNFVLQ